MIFIETRKLYYVYILQENYLNLDFFLCLWKRIESIKTRNLALLMSKLRLYDSERCTHKCIYVAMPCGYSG